MRRINHEPVLCGNTAPVLRFAEERVTHSSENHSNPTCRALSFRLGVANPFALESRDPSTRDHKIWKTQRHLMPDWSPAARTVCIAFTRGETTSTSSNSPV